MNTEYAIDALQNHPVATNGEGISVDNAHDGLDELQRLCYGLARHSGWWSEFWSLDAKTKKLFIGTKIALIHSEISEGLEGYRKDLMDDHLPERKMLEVELADAIIRILDTAGGLNLDVAGAVIEKLAYNQQRADHKPEARAAEGGKRF